MKKSLILGILLLTVVLFGCETSELPPEPGNPSAPSGQAYAYYEGYAPPVDVFNSDLLIYFLDPKVINSGEQEDSFEIDVEVNHDGAYIYRYGYYYSSKKEQWLRFEFPQTTVSGSNWIKEDAWTRLSLDKYEFDPGENYIVAYSCKKQNNEWKCGCASQYDCNKWMLQSFVYRDVDLPPEPIEPGEIVTLQVSVSPNGNIARPNTDIRLSAFIESQLDITGQISNAVFNIFAPDGTTKSVAANQEYPMECYQCPDDMKCYRKFSCYTSFSADYNAVAEGRYGIDFKAEGLQNARYHGGNFYISNSVFDDNLIESNIGKYSYIDSNGYMNEENQFYLNAAYKVVVQQEPYVKANWAGITITNNDGEIKEFYNAVSGWEKIDKDGNIIYKLYDNGCSTCGVGDANCEKYCWYHVEYRWISNSKVLMIYSDSATGEPQIDELVVAYLAKHPVNEANITTCLTDTDCGANQFCRFQVCPGTPTFTQNKGQCADIPTICTALYAPVCGCNGETYDNECTARTAKTSIEYSGECTNKTLICTDSDGGKNYDVKGNTKATDGSDSTDVCSDVISTGKGLVEYYCDENATTKYMTYVCPNSCSDGACI